METKLTVRYCSEVPSAQTALNIFEGTWKSALPPGLALTTGSRQGFYADARVHWVASLLPGGLKGFKILELGPFEGYDSRLFEELGAESILAVEGNNINFLKCLVLKHALSLEARFVYGGFLKYLQSSEERFDIVWASGVLYHSEDPLELLAQIGSRTNRIFLWTHYYDDSILETPDRKRFIAANNVWDVRFGERCHLHYRSYGLEHLKEGVPLHYEGGQRAYCFWMERQDINRVLGAMGFRSIQVHTEGKLNGMPVVSLFAERIDS
jgi:SAM-dependent methyltransferase